MEKGLKEHILDMAALVLIALASFGLGRLGSAEPSEPLTIDYFAETAESRALSAGAAFADVTPGGVVASKKGTKYHLPWCSGAQTISGENRVYFESEEAAKSAGYEPAKNCKGL